MIYSNVEGSRIHLTSMPIAKQSRTEVVEESLRRGRPAGAVLLLVDAGRQRLAVWDADRWAETYAVSTGRAGLGERSGSRRTPRGFHEIRERIGGGAAAGQVFAGRIPTRRVLAPAQWNQPGGEDLILSRILWLSGLESGRNLGGEVDTHRRMIYLHGTNQEHRLGTPASAGCIRMANEAIIELFARIGERTAWCWIGEECRDG